MTLYDSLFRSQEADLLLSDENFLKNMLMTEIALAQSQAENGIFKREYADAIAAICKIENIDLVSLRSQLPLGGNAAIPMVQQLRLLLSKKNEETTRYLHYGATSQDIVDTALVLQIKEYSQWLLSNITKLEEALIYQIKTHRQTVMIGRTLLQHATPITFGYKVLGWFEAINGDKIKLKTLLDTILKLQLGGPVGIGSNKIDTKVVSKVAEILELEYAKSWHTQRGVFSEWAAFLGILSGNLGKIAKDISLLMQTEVAEVFEGAAEGKGGSSSMPHKRNPVTCVAILANANRTPHLVAGILLALPQEHERAVGGWHAEWEPLNDLMRLTAGSLEKSINLIQNLEVDAEKMKENIELTNGLVYSENILNVLSAKMTYETAQNTLTKAAEKSLKEKKHLKYILKEMDLGLIDLDTLFNPLELISRTNKVIDDLMKDYENKL